MDEGSKRFLGVKAKSKYMENDPLQYFWSEGTNRFATGMLATNRFSPGSHTITLIVSDGQATGTNSARLEVLSPAQAVGVLATLIANSELGRKNINPLLATLEAAGASFARGNAISGINQLEAFQNKVRAQIAPLDSALAGTLIEAAQEIIDVLISPAAFSPANGGTEKLMQVTDRKFHWRFHGRRARAYFIEASTDLTDWAIIGVARAVGAEEFDFEDVRAAQFRDRFYRIVEQ